jgi:hypothetical protein
MVMNRELDKSTGTDNVENEALTELLKFRLTLLFGVI